MLWIAVLGLLALNFWFSGRVPVGAYCPLLTVPKVHAAPVPTSAGLPDAPCGATATC